MGPKMPDSATYKLCYFLNSPQHEGRMEEEAVWHADTWGHRGVVPVGFYDRSSMIMRTGRTAAAATERERPL